MNDSISVWEKRDFLKAFLKGHKLKRRECAWLLNYLLSDDDLLKHVHIVEKAEFCPKALIISSAAADQMPFTFHKHQYVTMDAEKTFHDIRLHPDEEVYIQLNFPESDTDYLYKSVLEENPYLPGQKEEKLSARLFAEFITDEALKAYERNELQKEIDAALDRRDKQAFSRLSSELNALETD
ncbi:ReoY family proteolytic degradation factor [Alteribacillus sp. HJP-4]|uniref:ReoY family proteolytic degradation factor n=1 Tax=Alteribacillus sp. HJP-4 TaxID=2775394 RepID=UPI0035CD3564